MQMTMMPYQWFAAQGQTLRLLVVNKSGEEVVRCLYGSDAEWAEDIALLRGLPPGDEAGAGVAAFPEPLRPTLSASRAILSEEDRNLLELPRS